MDISTLFLAITTWIAIIVSVIRTYSTVLLVIVTWIAIILTYRSRPIKLEVRKKHSDDLKELLDNWRRQMPQIESVSHLVVRELPPSKALVEEDFLFSDLKNHMPSELNLFVIWGKYKEQLDHYNMRRYALLNNVKQKITGLMPAGESMPPLTSIEGVLNHIYYYLFDAVNGKRDIYTNADYRVLSSPTQHYLEVIVSNITESGDRESRTTIAESGDREFINNLERIHKDLIEELTDEAEFVKEAKGLISLKKDLQGYKKQLNQGLDYYTRIPILPKNCKYIGWALPGFLDTIKGKIKWILKSLFSIKKKISDKLTK